MKAANRFRLSCLLTLALTLGGGSVVCRAQAATKALPSPVLHDGTPVYLKLARTVSSESDQPGEPVEFILKKDLIVDSKVLLAQGASVYGVVTAARLDDRASGVGGMVEFRLAALELPNGQQIPLRTIPQVPSGPDADVKPDAIVDLVNSPFGPFAHFNKGNVTTVPKEMLLTLYVAADVAIGAQPVVRASAGAQMDSISAHILHSNTGGKSLGELAREQRERGKIGGVPVSGSQ